MDRVSVRMSEEQIVTADGLLGDQKIMRVEMLRGWFVGGRVFKAPFTPR
jgi:hypothetical protein